MLNIGIGVGKINYGENDPELSLQTSFALFPWLRTKYGVAEREIYAFKVCFLANSLQFVSKTQLKQKKVFN